MSALLLPHWGGLARCFAGLVCLALAAWHTGLGPAWRKREKELAPLSLSAATFQFLLMIVTIPAVSYG